MDWGLGPGRRPRKVPNRIIVITRVAQPEATWKPGTRQ